MKPKLYTHLFDQLDDSKCFGPEGDDKESQAPLEDVCLMAETQIQTDTQPPLENVRASHKRLVSYYILF